MTAPVVAALGPGDAAAWDAFVAAHPHGLAYHTIDYRDLLVAVTGGRAESWTAREDGRITGILSAIVKDGPWGPVLNSLPFFGSIGGVLATTDAARAALTARLAELGAATAAWTVVENPFDGAALATPDDGRLVGLRVAQVTSLLGEGDPEARLAARVDASARRNVRRAQAAGVVVRVGGPDDVGSLAALHRETMDAIGGRAKPDQFFEAIRPRLGPGSPWELLIAEREGRVTAALLTVAQARTVEYFIPATALEERVHQPMALLLWRAMTEAARRGAARWNWGGTGPTQTTLWRFKHKWGAVDHPYRHLTRLNDASLLERTPAELLDAYPGVFVVPFDQLKVPREAIR